MSDDVLLRPSVSQRFIPVDWDQIKAALERAGLNHSTASRELCVPLRTWRNWITESWMPANTYVLLALLIGLPEPDESVNVPRTPWVVLRRVEDLAEQFEIEREQGKQAREQLLETRELTLHLQEQLRRLLDERGRDEPH